MTRAAVLLLCAAGCDRIFQLEHLSPVAAPDVGSACVPARAHGTQCRQIAAAAAADTYLDPLAPDIAFGHADAVKSSDGAPALFAFELAGMTPTEQVVSAQLVIATAEGREATACGTSASCGICSPTYQSWSLHWVSASWSEDSATFRSDGSDDRSRALVLGVPPAAGAALAIDLGEQTVMNVPADCYLSGSRLSVLLSATGGTAWFAAHDLGTCGAAPNATANIQVTLCDTT